MILNVHIPGAPDHEIGDDIWQEPLADAIRFEAENVASTPRTRTYSPPPTKRIATSYVTRSSPH